MFSESKVKELAQLKVKLCEVEREHQSTVQWAKRE